MLGDNYIISAFSHRLSGGVSLVVGYNLHADVNVFSGEVGHLVVADVASSSG